MSNRVIQQLPRFKNAGVQCLDCGREASHYPHPTQTYILHGGKSMGELYRPTTEHPMPGVLGLAFFYSDIDLRDLDVDKEQVDFASYLYIPLYLYQTEQYASAFVTGMGLIQAPFYQVSVGLASMYRVYHFAALYMSYLTYHQNR
jgi:hypothetical protein